MSDISVILHQNHKSPIIANATPCIALTTSLYSSMMVFKGKHPAKDKIKELMGSDPYLIPIHHPPLCAFITF